MSTFTKFAQRMRAGGAKEAMTLNKLRMEQAALAKRAATTVAQAARKASAVARARGNWRAGGRTFNLSGMGRELKFVDIRETPDGELPNNVMIQNAEPITLNAIASGSGASQREGNQVWWKSIDLRYIVTRQPFISTANKVDTCHACVMLIWDEAPGLDEPSIDDILTKRGTHATPLSHMNLEYRERFKVLLREHYVFPAVETLTAVTAKGEGGADDRAVDHTTMVHQTSGQQERFLRINQRSTYRSAEATFAAISKGALYLVAFSDSALGNAQCPLIKFECRLRFGEQE